MPQAVEQLFSFLGSVTWLLPKLPYRLSSSSLGPQLLRLWGWLCTDGHAHAAYTWTCAQITPHPLHCPSYFGLKFSGNMDGLARPVI